MGHAALLTPGGSGPVIAAFPLSKWEGGQVGIGVHDLAHLTDQKLGTDLVYEVERRLRSTPANGEACRRRHFAEREAYLLRSEFGV
jgi:hypothetical protein